MPVERHFWYIMHRGSAISDEQILSMCAEMPSGPLAFLLSSLQMMDDILSFEIFMSRIELFVSICCGGRVDSMSKGLHWLAK